MTNKNKAIFDMVDKNKDGVIDKKEAQILQGNLLTSSGGNGKLSKREANKTYGEQMNAFEAISSLADQQAAFESGVEYVETNGNKSTHYSKGYSYAETKNGEIVHHTVKGLSYTQETDQNGAVTTTLDDGTQEIQYKDGTSQQIKADGTVITYDKNGNKTSVTINGNTTTFPDDNTSITKNTEGQIVQTVTIENGAIIRTDFEYQDGKTIEREYSEIGDDAPLTEITVKEKKDGHNIDTKFATEEDMTNNRPSEIVTDAHNPTQKTVTKFTYNENGTYSTETTDSAGKKTVKNFNADGTEIVKEQKPEVPTTHKVVKGESITKIVTDALAQQGIENPTPEQLKEAKKEFLEANKDLVKTYKGVKKEWHGNKFFYPDDVVKIPNFAGEKTTQPEDKPKGDSAVQQRQQEIQAQLGDSAKVTITEDGKLEVRTPNGDLLPEATKKANAGIKKSEVEQPAIPTEENLSEEENEAIATFDTDKSGTLNKAEYTATMMKEITNLGIVVNDSNREQIQELIDEAFAKIDEENKDEELTKAELAKKGTESVEQIADRLNEIMMAQLNPEEEIEDNSNLTITDGSNYDLQNDQTFITLTSEIEKLNEEIRNMESQYGIKPGEPNMKKMGFDAVSTYRELNFDLRGLERDLERYQNKMSEWQDGSISQMTINGYSFETKKVTLSNGQRALEINGKYYALESNGWIPDFTKEIILSE